MPWALQLPRSPAAPGLHCSGLRWRRHACFSTAVPDSLSLEVGGRSRPPPTRRPTRRPTTGFKATSSCPKTTAPSTLDPSSNERIRTPQHFLPGCHGGPEGRITADCPPTPTHHYPILLQLSTTPTKYCATSRGRGQGRRGACDVIFWEPSSSPGAQLLRVLLLEKRLHLVSTRLDIFPQRPRPHRVPPFLAPFIPPAD